MIIMILPVIKLKTIKITMKQIILHNNKINIIIMIFLLMITIMKYNNRMISSNKIIIRFKGYKD